MSEPSVSEHPYSWLPVFAVGERAPRGTAYMKDTGRSSQFFGPCEVCALPVSDVFIRVLSPNDMKFGHRNCLVKVP